MSKTKFTVGSWSNAQGWVVANYRGCSTTICSIYATKVDGEHEHNANLIAAAPELYEALSELIIRAEEAMLSCNFDAGEYDIEMELEPARAALAKARCDQ